MSFINLPNNKRIEVKDIALACPFCGTKVIPRYLYGVYNQDGTSSLFTLCPNEACKKSYVSIMRLHIDGYQLDSYQALPHHNRSFSETITSISSEFVSIYNQAFTAEQMNLDSICGVGYRKALEFLIKDYAISTTKESEHENIKKLQLMPCLNQYIKDTRVNEIAKRAIWLGNDETHYVRKWDERSLKDLKGLIDLTLYWIESEIKSNEILSEMPEKTKSE